MHTGKVRVSPHLPFGGDRCNVIKASGVFLPEEKRLWLPVSVYLIEHPKGLVLLDTGWSREMSPRGCYDATAQKRQLGRMLYRVNQGVVPEGQTAVEQLSVRGIKPRDIDIVLVSHLDCDHASALSDFADVGRILVSNDELEGDSALNPVLRTRFKRRWWSDVPIEPFEYERSGQGPFGRSFDLFGDGSIELTALPGHSPGLFATLVRGEKGQFANLVSDGAYGRRSWEEMVLPGIALDRKKQRASLEWIARMDRDPLCIGTYANHDVEIKPQTLEL